MVLRVRGCIVAGRSRGRRGVPYLNRYRAEGRVDTMASPLSFQDIILSLSRYWADQGCVVLQPYDTEVGVWYWPPRAGLLDVWIRARAARARSHFWLDDEWGWSDSHSRVWSYMTVNVSPVAADKDYQQIWWAWAKGVDE